MTKVQITIKNVYGRDTIYPVCTLAKGFAAIAGTKTLTEESIRVIIKMGFEIEQVNAYSLSFGSIKKVA